MNAEIKLKIVAGLVASLILIALCYAAYLSGPIGRRNAVFFFGVLAIMVFLDWRKARRRKADSCVNCQRDAQFCWPCCDAINTTDALSHLAGIRNAIGANADAQAHFERAAASFVVRLLDTGEALPATTVRFGTGGLIVNTGTYGDEPAVYVDRAPYRGVPGEKAPDVPAGTPAMLRLLFPTREQAKVVCDALVGSTGAKS